MRHENSAAATGTGARALLCQLSRTFYTALLLAANIEQAEAALAKAIELWDPNFEPGEALFQKAVITVVLSNPVARSSGMETFETAESLVPIELRGILRLPKLIRHCYVLRILVRLPERFVAGLLHLSTDDVNRNMCAGLERLATMTMAANS